MKLHEFQGKELLRRAGVPLLPGRACRTPEEVEAAARELGPPVVVKAQIHAGGRGKGTVYAEPACRTLVRQGGVALAADAGAARALAAQLIGNYLCTAQTAGRGRRINTVLVEAGCRIARELYFSVLLDRAQAAPVVVASDAGGMDIEEVAAREPGRIRRVAIDPALGMLEHQARRLGYELGLAPAQVAQFVPAARALVRAFLEHDADLVEVNPLVVAADDRVLALDCKMGIDDNALFRHPELAAWLDPDEEEPAELEAKRHEMAFVKLEGNIGCMVNGAGLAMATIDAIALYGGEHGAAPANFLDVGGGASAEKVTVAFKLILRDPAVEAILVNIFGGIMKCDTIASGILAAVREAGLDRPLVVRLEGTRVEEGKRLLAESGLAIIPADDLKDGCIKAAAAAARWRAERGLPPRPPIATAPHP